MAAPSGADNQEHWSGKFAFIMAAVGSAVGLGNLVRFPYIAGDSGGGAFVLIYLACVLLLGLPVLVAELMIGRRGGGSAIGAVVRLAKNENNSKLWGIVPAIGVVTTFLVLSYYCVLAGWVLNFVFLSVQDVFSSVGSGAGLGAVAYNEMTEAEISGQLGELVSNPWQMVIMTGLFMALTIFIVSRGIKGGIETAANILMPIFFVLLLLLTISSLINGNDAAALDFLFKPDWSEVDGGVILRAVGQAFFSLSLGSAMMITYGLYMNKDEDIPGSARIVAFSDTSVALIAGLAIFPIIFASPVLMESVLAEDPGLGLMFESIPLAFHQLPFGGIFAIAFFIMTIFAALTSAIALLEVSVAWFDGDIDVSAVQRRRRRIRGAIILGGLAFLIGCMNALSQVPTSVANTFFNTWEPLSFIALFDGMTILDAIDTLTGSVLLPIGGVATAVFAGWVISAQVAKDEIGFKKASTFTIWRTLVRYVVPIFIGIVLVYGAIIGPMRARADAGSEAAQVIEEMTTPSE